MDLVIDTPRPSAVTNLKPMEVTCMKVFCTLFSIVTYVADVILDILVADRYYEEKEYLYFGLTILFIAIPPIVMTIFTMFWYIADEKIEPISTPPLQWIIRIILLLFLMAPVLRNLEALYYGLKSVRSGKKMAKDNYIRRMGYENLDASMLRLFQAFVESGPQALLQIYIIGTEFPDVIEDFDKTKTIQVISVFTSLLSMSCAVSSYQSNLRASLDYKNDHNCSVGVFPFLWRFCELTSRLLTLGLFASVEEFYLPITFLMHSTVMFIVTRIISTGFCGNGAGEILYSFLLAYMYFFCFINPQDEKTWASYTFYYCLNLIENGVLINHWYKMVINEKLDSIFVCPVFIVAVTTYGLGIIIMVFYYTLLHPTRGRIYGRPSPIKPDETIAHIEHLAREFGLDEEIINRFRQERENIPSRNAADFFQNLPQEDKKKKKKKKKRSKNKKFEEQAFNVEAEDTPL